jgi:hypothetical protein
MWMFSALAAPAFHGCASDTPLNPSFPLTRSIASAAIRQMQSDPAPLPRPVITLGGIHDPGFVAPHLADFVRDSIPDRTQVLAVSFFGPGSLDACAEKLIGKVQAAFPSDDPARTTEVDVVAFSMGGLVARHAASDTFAATHARRLAIARLFTIATPHLGANLADLPTLDERVRDMREGSAFLATLNAAGNATTAHEIFPYVRLDDGVIGEEHAAPPGATAWWVPSGFTLSHVLAAYDERILADILRRLRGDEPFTLSPAAPPPDDS